MKTLFLLFPLFAFSQIGVNTSTPDAGIDLNIPDTGIKFPEVLLLHLGDRTTIKSNNNGFTKRGTVVFNIANSNGREGIKTGMYYFDGITWRLMGDKEDYDFRTQTVRKSINNFGNFLNISELNMVFVSDWTGSYKVTASMFIASEGREETMSIGRGKIEILKGNTVIASQIIETMSYQDALIYKQFTLSIDINLNKEEYYLYSVRFTPLQNIKNCEGFYLKDSRLEIEFKKERFN